MLRHSASSMPLACRHDGQPLVPSASTFSCSSLLGAPIVSAVGTAIVVHFAQSFRSGYNRQTNRRTRRTLRCGPPRCVESTTCATEACCKSGCNGRLSTAKKETKCTEEHDNSLWQPRGSLEFVANLVELLLPGWIISKMEKITEKETSTSSGLPAFIEHSKVVTSWEVPRQRSFGAHLLRQTVPKPLARLFRAILNWLKTWPDLHKRAIRFGSATIGAATSHWLVGKSRILSKEEEQTLVQKLRQDGIDVAPDAVMLLQKCKFIEECGGCKDLCLNVCKAGTEEYMTTELDFPVRMMPNFKDHSCTILLMEQPVPPEEDPLFKQPCGAEACDKKFAMPRTPRSVSQKVQLSSARPQKHQYPACARARRELCVMDLDKAWCK